MNREFFVTGMMEYGGLGLLIVVGLFIAVLDLVRALLVPHVDRSRILHQAVASRKPYPQTKPSQINQ